MSDETESAKVWREANEIPRRRQMQAWLPAEIAIYDAKMRVEEMPAHIILTQAVALLSQAQDLVADYIDMFPKDSSLTPYRELLAAAKELLSSTNWKHAAWPVEKSVARLRDAVVNAER